MDMPELRRLPRTGISHYNKKYHSSVEAALKVARNVWKREWYGRTLNFSLPKC